MQVAGMTSIKGTKKESLEERLERIQKKNEEIEKKHKEAERDRMIAKMQNALVDMKPPADDWPREHKYDKLDITYDVPESQLEAEKAAKLEHQQKRALKAARFTDIPPDPNSFLADEERDGVKREMAQDKAKPQNKGRQITGRKKFPPKSASQEFGSQEKPINEQSIMGPNPNWRRSTSDADSAEMQKNFENLTVSVSQDGDFKSVRLTQAPIIGSGRVGPRQITKTQFQPMQQHAAVQPPPPSQPPPLLQHQQQSIPFDKHSNQRKSDRRQRMQPNKELPKRSNSFKATTATHQGAIPGMGVWPVPATGLGAKPFSVQDRLKRVVQVQSDAAAQSCANNKNMILHIISSNEIIAAEDRNQRTPNA